MKTCPACGETYSERIDFCFEDGEVLLLLPSAVDAPVPRRLAAVDEAPPDRFHTGHTGEQRTPAPAVVAENRPPAAPAPPAPAADEDDTLVDPVQAVRVQAMLAADAAPEAAHLPPADVAPEVAPAVAAAPLPPVAVPPAPVFDEIPDDVRAPEERRKAAAWMWGLAAFAVAAAAVALLVVILSEPRSEAPAPVVVSPPVPTVPSPPAEVVQAPPVPPAPAETEAPDATTSVDEGIAAASVDEGIGAASVDAGSAVASEAALEPAAPPPATAAPVEPAPSRVAAPAVASMPAASTAAPPTTRTVTTSAPAVTETPPVRTAPAPEPRPAIAAPATSSVAASSGSPWDAPAAAQEGIATITSDPPGAVVWVDGRLRGKTPLQVRLSHGAHELKISLDGYETVSRTFDLRAAELKLPVVLQTAVRQGNVLLVAPPGWEGATVLVDGRERGRLPVQLLLSEGAHTFELRRGSERAVQQRIVRLADDGLTRVQLDVR